MAATDPMRQPRTKRTSSTVFALVALALGYCATPYARALASNTNEADHPVRQIVIGIDLSKSNPLIRDDAFAQKVADRVTVMITGLEFRSEVHVRTFGEYSASANSFQYDIILSVRHRPEDVAKEVARLIAGTPMLVRTGKLKAQNWTNIIAFLDNTAHAFSCTEMPTIVVLATDGIEDSEYAHLDSVDSHLPLAQDKPFKGCVEFQILGIGQGTHSPEKTNRLRDEWKRWAISAGFASFSGLNDW